MTNAFKRIRARLKRPDGGDDDSIDSLQDAFCRLWSNKEKITGQEQAEGMLIVTARNIRIDNLRRKARHPETGLDSMQELSTSDFSDDDVSETFKRVDRLVRENISERDREILYRRDRDSWDFDEIAQQYGISEANVRMIVSRTRKAVRELYRKQNKGI